MERIARITIIPTTPFNFDATFYKPDHFTSADNYWESGIRWQTWRWYGEALGLKIINTGSVDDPNIIIEIYSNNLLDDNTIDSLIREIEYRYTPE